MNHNSKIERPLTFAPVIIPTLCRYTHFKACLESLMKCTWAEETDVYIGLDYPAKESHWEGYKEICKYLEDVGKTHNFNKLTVIKRDWNYGVGPNGNFESLRDFIFSFSDRLIASEDDNEFSPNFLDYINKGLARYNDLDDVVAICGYNYPVEMMDYSQNAYLSHNYSAWGCGIWKSKNEKYLKELTFEKSCKILKSPTLLLKILVKKPTLAISLWRMSQQRRMLGDICQETYNIIGNHYCLFPRLSLVRNWGHDGSGINCGDFNNDLYLNQPIDANNTFNLSRDVKILPRKFNKRLRKFFGDRPRDLILRSCKYVKRKIFN